MFVLLIAAAVTTREFIVVVPENFKVATFFVLVFDARNLVKKLNLNYYHRSPHTFDSTLSIYNTLVAQLLYWKRVAAFEKGVVGITNGITNLGIFVTSTGNH